MQTQVAEKYMESYKVEEIPSYRYCVYRRRDPSISQIDARTDRGTYIDKLEEGRMDSGKRLAAVRALMKGWKVKGKVRFVEWVPSPKVRALPLASSSHSKCRIIILLSAGRTTRESYYGKESKNSIEFQVLHRQAPAVIQ